MFEIWWDRDVETAKKMEHNRPDVVVIDRLHNHWTIVDFSVPWDVYVVSKEDEKIRHYSPLANELRKLHRVSTKIILIIVGSLGTISKNLTGYLKQLDIPDIAGGLQTSALLGTTYILKKVLSQEGEGGS
jgi:D-alanine-D-alanine ligase-like ATP-grasp enzyme